MVRISIIGKLNNSSSLSGFLLVDNFVKTYNAGDRIFYDAISVDNEDV